MYPGAHRLKEGNIKGVLCPQPQVATFFVALTALLLKSLLDFSSAEIVEFCVPSTVRGLQISDKQDRCGPCVEVLDV